MINPDLLEKSKKIIEKVKIGSKFLVIPDGSRVDDDCIGSALAVKWWLKKLGKKEVKIYVFGVVPEYMKSFPGMDQIENRYIKEVDFNYYDLIFLVDTGDWDRVLTRDYQKIFTNTPIERFVNIDHHQSGSIQQENPDQTIRAEDICASKVLFDYLVEPSNVQLDEEGANYFYSSLAGDTGIFKYIKKDTFEFADKLLKAGANHIEVTDRILSVSKDTLDFFNLACEMTNYYPEIKSTALTIDEDRIKVFNEKINPQWEDNDLLNYYKEMFQRRIQNYDYGIIFRWDPHSKLTRISWRTRNSGNTIEIMPLLQSLGFKAGGHRNAGGGSTELKPEEAEEKFVEEMKKKIK